MVAGPRSTDGNFAGPIDVSHAADRAKQRGAPGFPETLRTQVDEFLRESHGPPGSPNGNGTGRLLAMVRRWFGLESKPAEDHDGGHEGWIALSDIVSFFETVRTHNLRQIRAHYDEIVTNGFESGTIYDLLMNRFHVAPARLERNIGHQSPNPYRSVTELTSNAVDAMNGMDGDVSVAIENGRYTVSDSGTGMSAQDIFEKLLIPQLSEKSGRDTIGRFGIGFYAAFVHLGHPNSRVIVETKRDGHQAIRIEFIRLNNQLGVRVESSTRMDRGTAVLVRDDGIDPERMTQELFKNLSYVMGRAIIVNGRRINNIDPAHVRGVGNGTMYVSEKDSREGKVVITMGGRTFEEFVVSGRAVPELVVFDFRFNVEFPESIYRIQVNRAVVNQVGAFIDATADIEGYANKIAYLNAIAPMLVELQKRNKHPDSARDIVHYARSAAAKYLRGKTVIPDDPFYNAISQGEAVRVNDLYLGGDWQARFDEPAEWRGSTKILLTDFIPFISTGIMFDKKRNTLLLARSLYEMHRNDPAGLKVLLGLAKAEGSWKTQRAKETAPIAASLKQDKTAKGAGLEPLLHGASQIPVVSGSKAFSLVNLNIAVTSNSDWWEKFQGNNRRASRKILEQTAGADRQISARRVQHAMYNLNDGLNLLYLRALIQNSLDAIRANEVVVGSINVESFEDNGAHVLRIADPVGMSFSDALNNLFVFGESTTKGFGVGFFTIYPGAKEVRIKTGTGDGKVSIFTLRPVYKGEEVIDVAISYVVKKENFKGTIIERTSNSEIPELDAAFDRSQALSYGRFLSGIGVTYNGTRVNLEMQTLADQDVPQIGRVRIYEAAENAITRGGLYVKNIPTMFFANLPPAIRRLIAPRGIVIDLPESIPIVRSGNEFLDPVNLEWRLMPQVNAMLLRSYLIRFAGGEVDITGMPDVYFNSMYDFANGRAIATEIRENAERLMRGEGLPEIDRYQDERYFLQLLTLLPCLRIDGEVISMFELLERFEKGVKIDTSKLPHAVTSRLDAAMRSREARGSNREMMDSIAQELGIAERGRDLTLGDWREDKLHRHWERLDALNEDANSYDAFLSIVGELMASAGNSHHTIGFSSFLERNALADHAIFAGRIEMFFAVTAVEKYARELFEILSAEEYPAGRMQALMAELIDKVTHEMTHDLLERPDEIQALMAEMIDIVTHEMTHDLLKMPDKWTRDTEFYERQQEIVMQLLRSGPLQLEQLWHDLKVQYPNPTFMPAQDYLKLLLARGGETPSGTPPAASPAATPTPAPQAPPAPAAPTNGSPEAASSEQPSVIGLADTDETSGGQYLGYDVYGIEATARRARRSAAQLHAQRPTATQQVHPAQVRTPIAAPVRPSIGVAP